MITLEKFTGINNVVPAHKLKPTALAVATNVDIGLAGEVRRRSGYTRGSTTAAADLFRISSGKFLARSGGDLNLVASDLSTTALLKAAVGTTRMWFTDLPDGRTAFTNGTVKGITDGVTTTDWGIPLPASIGSMTDVAGSLFPGDYQYAITYVRTADKLEGAPSYSDPAPVADGGILLTGLPVLAGYSINVYLTSANGGQVFYAGNTIGPAFSYMGTNDALVKPCLNDYLDPMPTGILPTVWRGRTLVAAGNVLWASKPYAPEICDMRRDFKQFTADITMVQPVNDGVYVGTTAGLTFLAGTEFDKLVAVHKADGRVVLGSGVTVHGEKVKRGDGVGQGTAMLCICDGFITAGFNGGEIHHMTEGVYRNAPESVVAQVRDQDDFAQYVAIPL